MPLRKLSYDIWSRNIFPVDMEGCVLYLPLWQEDMQGSTLISYDPNHHSCTVNDAVYSLNLGRVMDGDDDIDCGDSTLFDPRTSNFTIETWVKITTTDSQYRRIISKQPDGNNFIIVRVSNTDHWEFNAKDGTTTVAKQGASAINNALFYNVMLVRVGTTFTLYVNNVSECTDTEGAFDDLNPTGGNMFLGQKGDDSEYLKGIIGGTRWYNRALSSAERQHNIDATKGRYV